MARNEHGTVDFPENPEENQVFIDVNNTQWKFSEHQWGIFEPYYIVELPDVNVTDLQEGDILEWDGTHWVNGDEITDLSNLEDVTLTDPQEGDFLVYDGAEWVNEPIIAPDFCSVYLATLSNPNSEGWVDPLHVEFDTVKYDPNSLYDSIDHRIVIKKVGLYKIYSQYQTDFGGGASVPHQQIVRIYDTNDTLKEERYYRFGMTTSSDLGEVGGEFLVYRELDIGDYIELWQVRNKRTDTTNPSMITKNHLLLVEQL